MKSIPDHPDTNSKRVHRILIRSENMAWSSGNYTFWKEFKLFLSNINFLHDRKNWQVFMSWFTNALYIFFGVYYLFNMLAWDTFLVGYSYSFILVYHHTVWYHRYASHGAFKFKNKFWIIIHRNMFLKMFSEERYSIAHRVHHALSDRHGDPYTPRMGFWYVFFAEYNNVSVSPTLSEKDYHSITPYIERTGVPINTYEQYKKYGTISKPWPTILEHILNLAFWSIMYWLIGGIDLIFAMLGAVYLGQISIRLFNFLAHGGFKNIDRPGDEDLSLNQLYFGILGEWHNNHHLLPKSAKSGYKKYQIDFPWLYIKLMNKLGVIEEYNNQQSQFEKIVSK